MKLLERLTKRVATTASGVLTDSVKAEAKNAVSNALPVVLSVAAFVVGLVIFSKNDKGDDSPVGTYISKMDVTVNNYILDGSAKSEMIEKLLNQ